MWLPAFIGKNGQATAASSRRSRTFT